MENSNQFIITREMYKKIKGMNREQMQVFATEIYLEGVKSVESESIDLDRLRTEIPTVLLTSLLLLYLCNHNT